jgi:hypothetical protein
MTDATTEIPPSLIAEAVETAIKAYVDDVRRTHPEAARWPDDYSMKERTGFREHMMAALVHAGPILIRGMEMRKDAAYLERNRLVALLARIYPAGVAKTAIEGWSPDWHNCVYIDTPAGQLSWHFHDSHAHLFLGIPPYTKPWDGHSTETKYDRVAHLTDLLQRGTAQLVEAVINKKHLTEGNT